MAHFMQKYGDIKPQSVKKTLKGKEKNPLVAELVLENQDNTR